MRTLYLHIGHGKTGSSYIQSSLVLSRDALAARGIAYPAYKTDAAAAAGGMSSGNGKPLFQALESGWRAALLTRRLRRLRGHVLLSSELLLRHLDGPGAVARLEKIASRAGFARVEILLFIRDPLDHLPSQHQERIKRAGLTADLEDTLRRYDLPERVARFLEQTEAAERVDVTARNYSHRRGDLLDVVADWLDLPPAALTPPPKDVVNRSLSAAELEAQRLLNRWFGPSEDLGAARWSAALPGSPAETARPTRSEAEALIARMKPAIDAVNARVAATDAYRVEIDNLPEARSDPAGITLSHEHLDTMLRAVATEARAHPLRLWRRVKR